MVSKPQRFTATRARSARTQALADFKGYAFVRLVATEVASRGLDIKELPHVVNFELPNVPEDYVHRIGRTGRAGATGIAVSLVSPDEKGLLKDIEKVLRKSIPVTPVPSFAPAPPPLPDHNERFRDPRAKPQQRADGAPQPQHKGRRRKRPNAPQSQGQGRKPAPAHAHAQRPAGQRPSGQRQQGQRRQSGGAR